MFSEDCKIVCNLVYVMPGFNEVIELSQYLAQTYCREALFIGVERLFAKSTRADRNTLSLRLLDYQNFQGRFKTPTKQNGGLQYNDKAL